VGACDANKPSIKRVGMSKNCGRNILQHVGACEANKPSVFSNKVKITKASKFTKC